VTLYTTQVWKLQVVEGNELRERSENNSLRHSIIFADRGVVYDRNNVPLIWNSPSDEPDDFNKRVYTATSGFSHILGYGKYPQKDSFGFYFTEEFEPKAGLERAYNKKLSGRSGLKIIETNAQMEVVGDNTITDAEVGANVVTTIDSRLQNIFYEKIKSVAQEVGFTGGAGAFIDVTNGDVIALTSYPEYSSSILTEGVDEETINRQFDDSSNFFLNRAARGVYTPGSIMKPFVALAALNEGIITPEKKIVSTKRMIIPNPYNPDNPSVFTDWKAHGPVNVREALAYSSNVYFYQVGGGFPETGQRGVGITNLEKYYRGFGFGETFKEDLLQGPTGTIPNPEWKALNFDGDDWRLGDTYFTSIGQYGVQVTPLQVVRAIAGIANEGVFPELRITKDTKEKKYVPQSTIAQEIRPDVYKTVKAGMRDVASFGTGRGLNIPEVEIAAKTATAELGFSKENVNSWTTGFFPYQNPKYAFVIVMEQGNRNNLIGGVSVMRQILDWMRVNTPEYFNT
jgi:penicillin-binding protein 2